MDDVALAIDMATLSKTLVAELTDVAQSVLTTISDVLPVCTTVGGGMLVITIGYKAFKRFIK